MNSPHITITFRDGSAQVDYSIESANNALLAYVVIEAIATKETGLHIDDIRAIVDEQKKNLEAKDTIDIKQED